MTDIDHRILQGMFYRALMINYGYPGFDGPRLLRIIVAIIAADLCALQSSQVCGLRDIPTVVNHFGGFALSDRSDEEECIFRALRSQTVTP
jgi:hypothetical protein